MKIRIHFELFLVDADDPSAARDLALRTIDKLPGDFLVINSVNPLILRKRKPGPPSPYPGCVPAHYLF